MSEKDIEYIRVAAYYIWENEGRPEGRAEEIWWKACSQASACAKKAVAKPAAKKASAKKAVAKAAPKAVAKVAAKPVAKVAAKPVVKAAAVKAPAKKAAKGKINPVPVKTSATKIITPLYGSVKK